jgi:hypothetical protein
LNAPEMVSRFEALGNEIVASSPETALQELRTDQLKWARLIKDRSIKLE